MHTSERIPEAEAFVSKQADLQVAIRRDAQPVASATEVLAHRRYETHPGQRKCVVNNSTSVYPTSNLRKHLGVAMTASLACGYEGT